ncbi:GMC oxidoreductase [Actinomycetospora sp. TBRC 11914]|uniref:GMC oxidoreductase n=1 Tax=Actinomycetospora sp. TBRC 11914 TaxID=2729387 RepID=UPI00145DC64E|nr:GMC family oxidoreductase [Actinomycetospora sp. TBRC 11914]NMO91737.1 GMC family oxidoreductase [Actinomycetospora sp. TBRC 11914]
MTSSQGRYDALVIGSGAAGSIAVKELTERGLDVLLLEAGRDISEADFVPPPETQPAAMSIGLGGRLRQSLKGQYIQSRRAMFKEQTSDFLVNDRKHPYASDSEFLWIRGRQLGGRLHAYGRVLLRSSDHEFQAASHDGHGQDWPISYADLAPYYDRVEEFMGVYGSADGLDNLPDGVYRGPSLLTSAEKDFKATVEGRWPSRHVVPWRYAAPNLHRVPLGILAARETGRLTTRTDAVVSRIVVNPTTGRADGAVYVDRHTKREHRVHADIVMCCASGIESVRLLLNSATDGHPDGLGNSSGLLGRYFMDQTPSLLFGDDPHHPGFESTDQAPPDPYYPPIGGVYIPRFENVDAPTTSEFARGWAVQGTVGRMPVPEGSGGVVGLMGFGEMLPYYDNRITLHPRRKDAWGVPIPRVHLRITDNERALMRAQVRGLREMAEASGYRVNFAASSLGLDSRKVWPDADPFSRAIFRLGVKRSLAMGAAIHECGGARMGNDPGSSVLNEFNQSWDIPNLFVTDAASYVSNGGVGPTLTIMALTARAAEHAATQHADGSL